MYSEKFFKKSIKLLTSPFLVMLQTFLLKEHSKENCALKGHSTRELEHTKGIWALKVLGHSRQLGTWALEHLRHSRHLGTWVLEGHSKSTWALRHLNTQGTRGTLFSRLLQMSKISHLVLYWKCFHVFDYITTIAKFFKEMSFLSITFWNLLYKRKFFLPSVNISKI